MPETQKSAFMQMGSDSLSFLTWGTGKTFAERAKLFKMRSFHKRFSITFGTTSNIYLK